jgi:hypothetical protein
VFGEVRTSDTDEDLDILLAHLGCLPLALNLAAQYLRTRPRLSIDAYLSRLQIADLNPLEATFDLGWNYLSDERARRVLGIMAFCAPGIPVPLGLLRRASGIEDVRSFDAGLAHLASNAFIAVDSMQLPIIHPLVAEYVRSKTPEDQRGLVLASLMDALEESSTLALQSGRPDNFAPLRPHLESVLTLTTEGR